MQKHTPAPSFFRRQPLTDIGRSAISCSDHDAVTRGNTGGRGDGKGAKLFGVRTLLTTAHSETQKLVQQVQDVFADHVPIERTGLNAFEDERSRSTRIASRFPSPKELP